MDMHRFGKLLSCGSLVAGLLGAPTAAIAHHGWGWAEGEQEELRGTIREVYIGQPHPTLRVEAAAGGGSWIVELGNPRQTAAAGFVEGSAKSGDQVVALGNRSRDQAERRMKAVRIRVGDRTYDIYPERIRGS
jgi:hypothetical protein